MKKILFGFVWFPMFYISLLLLIGIVLNQFLGVKDSIIPSAIMTGMDDTSLILNELKSPEQDEVSAFVSVSVVDLENGVILPNQTVLVRDGKIIAVDKTKEVEIPGDAQILVEAHSEDVFLMPGMADMHTHIKFSADSRDEYTNLLLYLINGVTTVLTMGDVSGIPPQLKQKILSGEYHGPAMYTSKFAFGSTDGGTSDIVASTPEKGRQLVERAQDEGYDFIKVYNGITTDVFNAIVSEGRLRGLPVIGHGVRQPGMKYIVENGIKMIAHAEEFNYTYFNGTTDMSKVPFLTKLLLENDVYVTTTLVAFESIADFWNASKEGNTANQVFTSKDGVEFLAKERIESWQETYDLNYADRPSDIYPMLSFQQQFVKAFDSGGVKILLGSDSPAIPGVVPGFSLHREIELCTQAGMPTLNILQASTVNADKFIYEHLNAQERFGHIKEGYRADLILLRKNPLTDARNTNTIEGVMSRGRWYSKRVITEVLNEFRERSGTRE